MEQLLTAASALAKTIVFFPLLVFFCGLSCGLRQLLLKPDLKHFGLEAEIRAIKLHRKINCD